MKLTEGKTRGRIDGMAALANAIGGATMKTEEKPSVYENRPNILAF